MYTVKKGYRFSGTQQAGDGKIANLFFTVQKIRKESDAKSNRRKDLQRFGKVGPTIFAPHPFLISLSLFSPEPEFVNI
jgi:hypothetical protein